MEEEHRVGERVGKEEYAKNVLQKLPEKGAFEPAARQTDRKHPRHTPPSHTHLCLVDPSSNSSTHAEPRAVRH